MKNQKTETQWFVNRYSQKLQVAPLGFLIVKNAFFFKKCYYENIKFYIG